jgi:penicillin-insensitive murein endopeptidase
MKILILLSLNCLLISCSSMAQSQSDAWGKFKTPHPGPSEVIGGYSKGCLIGAESMTPTGPGYQVMRTSRARFYGHPKLVDFIKRISKKIKNNKHGVILVGDMAQAKGGPMRPMHASHQTGLDVDVWFYRPDFALTRSLTLKERETISSKSFANNYTNTLYPKLWKSYHDNILKLAANDPEIARIFVNPSIKKRFCNIYEGQEWISKIRPWYRHDDHFHARLKCPINDSQCTPQDPIVGLGCGDDLDWWFSDDFKKQYDEMEQWKIEHKDELPKIVELPVRCEELISM